MPRHLLRTLDLGPAELVRLLDLAAHLKADPFARADLLSNQTRLKAFAPFQVNSALVARARPDAIFMHCLPDHRGEEVTAEIVDGPQSVVFDQAENRLHTATALLAALIGGPV